jgi:hypothetical protein
MSLHLSAVMRVVDIGAGVVGVAEEVSEVAEVDFEEAEAGSAAAEVDFVAVEASVVGVAVINTKAIKSILQYVVA